MFNQSQFPATIDLSTLNGINGFMLTGQLVGYRSGYAVSAAGDINGDGIQDMLIGAPNLVSLGKVYVVFGKKTPWPISFSVAQLDGTNGFELDGGDNEYPGTAVSSAGDVNDDGVDDLLIGDFYYSVAYLLFGKKTPWTSPLSLSYLDGSNGTMILGDTSGSRSSAALSSAGDFNDDGIADIVISEPYYPPNSKVSVVFGSRGPWPSSFSLSTLNGTNGFALIGAGQNTNGGDVSGGGDFNGDGIDDILLGASQLFTNTVAGGAYIVFGKHTPWPAAFSVTGLNNSMGVEFIGSSGDYAGLAVTRIGDLNGDGMDDLAIGATGAVASSGSAGKTYVIFGKQNPWPTPFLLANLNGTNGFTLFGIVPNDLSGSALSTAGDINGDGLADFLIGANAALSYAGQTYVIFGNSNPWPRSFSLANLNGKNGFVVNGVVTQDNSGYSLSGGMDINGDGITDMMIGAYETFTYTGSTYVIFGDKQNSLLLTQNKLTIQKGQALTLNSSYLNSSSTHSHGVAFSIFNLQHGSFELVTNPGISINSFSQQQISAGQIQFVHDGGRIPPSYAVQVTGDTFVFIPPQPANITFIPLPPSLLNNQLNIAPGQTVYLTSNDLQATEKGINEGSLTFSVSQLTHGQFEDITATPLSNFTQQQIFQRNLRFVHDGGELPPTYKIAVSDGELSTIPQSALINFTPAETTILQQENNTVRNAILGASISGAMGFIFLGVKLFVTHHAAKNLQKVLRADAGETDIADRELHDDVIRPIAAQIFEQLDTTNIFGYRSEKTTKEYIAAVIGIVGRLSARGMNMDLQNKEPVERALIITEIVYQIKRYLPRQNTCSRFFKAEISPNILDDNLEEIANNVYKALHAGVAVKSELENNASKGRALK